MVAWRAVLVLGGPVSGFKNSVEGMAEAGEWYCCTQEPLDEMTCGLLRTVV